MDELTYKILHVCTSGFKCECLYRSNNADTNLLLDVDQEIIDERVSSSGAGSLESRGVGNENDREESWGEGQGSLGGRSLESEGMRDEIEREEGEGEGQGCLWGGN